MCGIAGVYHFNGGRLDRAQLGAMIELLKHRGPDGGGIWVGADGRVGLGHRRLAILDLSELGAQPMCYADRYTVTLNGEIYNYIEIREELLRKGY